MDITLTAEMFIAELEKRKSDSERKKYDRYFPPAKRGNDEFMGVRMGDIFKLAKQYISMPLNEVEKLLESGYHEVRVGGVSIMDAQARSKKTDEQRRKELFDLYIRRHDRINTWDLVDRSAIYVVGGYLADKPRDPLYNLAKSKLMPERRSAIIATAYFMMKMGQTEDVFRIAKLLIDDKEDLIHKAVGWMLRVASDVDRKQFLEFLDAYAARMPRIMLRYCIEKLSPEQRKHYMSL